MHTTIKDDAGRLEGVLGEKIAIAIRLTGGASRETWLLTLASGDEVVLRRDMGGEILDGALSRAEEFAVVKRAFEGGVKVARPRLHGAGPPAFFVSDRLHGESVGRRVVREPALASAREVLPVQMGEQLAKIHALRHDDLTFLPRLTPLQSLERAADQLARLDEPHPVLTLAIRWLRSHAPPPGPPVLVHGDFRVGNLMIGSRGLEGVFDWEFAHVGDAHEDLAWPCVRSWRFGHDHLRCGGVGDDEAFFAAYEKAGGRKVDRAAVAWWEAIGNLRWAIGCVAQAHRHLSGQAMSVELASLGRRTCEMEWELMELMERVP
jgi:aminoglycoside phosphotransferase (APT) family kinase protein